MSIKLTTSLESKNKDKFEIDVKRFYLPYVLKSVCPKCSKPFNRDFTAQYLSFPQIGQNQVNFWCDDCDHEWGILINLNISMKLVGDAV